jgi:CHAD domain-containing protein
MDNIVRLKAVKPELSGYISTAIFLLHEPAKNNEKVVHDVRVLMKRSRAVLKLIASQIDVVAAEKEIQLLRKVGRSLTVSREASVLRKVLKDLRNKYPDLFFRLCNIEQINFLLQKPEQEIENMPNNSEENEITRLLRKSGYRIRFMTMTKLDPVVMIKELERTYRVVADAYLLCRNDPKTEKLHNFRKKSKDLLYQLLFFRPLNRSKVKNLEEKLEKITALLGKYNDLSQLIGVLDYKYKPELNNPPLDELILRIREEQDILVARVWPQAFKIFCPGQSLTAILGFKILVI